MQLARFEPFNEPEIASAEQLVASRRARGRQGSAAAGADGRRGAPVLPRGPEEIVIYQSQTPEKIGETVYLDDEEQDNDADS